VIREAINKKGMVAIGKVVFTSREHMIALEARGNGLMGVTLRYPYEIRKEEDYFDNIPDEKIPSDMLELAGHIVDTKTGDFEPGKFEDQYEDAVRELLKRKQDGEKIEVHEERAPAKVINLMEALRRNVEAERAAEGRKAPADSVQHRVAKKKPARSSARHKRAG
jgi:DNA end-binding protein Ku